MKIVSPILRLTLPTASILFFMMPLVEASLNLTTNSKNTVDFSLIVPPTDATVYLGALFPIHEAPKEGNTACGPLQEEDGILALEALLFSLEQVGEILPPNITMGVIALDSCNSPEVALRQSLKFIKGYIASHNSGHGAEEFVCEDRSTPKFQGGHGYERMIGVIGGQQSSVSVQLANVLRLFNVTQISYRSTSSSLSQKEKYPHFLRTVPSDINQAEVILRVLEELGITYASLVYSDSEYGISGTKEILAKAENSSVCFATPTHPLKLSDSDKTYEDVFDQLVSRDKSKVVVLFSDQATAGRLLSVAKERQSNFLWVGSDGWTSLNLRNFSDVIEGAIGIQPMARTLDNFKAYMGSQKPPSSANPWFREYWRNHFDCDPSEEECLKNDLSKSDKFEDVKWLHFIRDSVYAFAHGLRAMWHDKCNSTGQLGLCPNMTHDGHIHGDDLYQYIKNVSFKDVTKKQDFRFQESGSGTPRYTIFSYRKPGLWKPIANFSYLTGKQTLKWDIGEPAFWRSDYRQFPASFCGIECGSRQDKIVGEDECCWQCKDCQPNQYLNNTTEFCETCEACEAPDEDGSSCVMKKEKYLDYKNPWAVTSMAFASLGVFSTVFVSLIFWVHIDTPVIKAASRELSYILLTGILMSFLMTFAILAPPSPLSCGITRFFLGFSYTLCYSAILTKTNRISRIFNKNPSEPRKARYTSPRSQIIIVILLVSVEILINVSWLIYYTPEIKKLCDPMESANILICKGINDHSYIVGFIYPLFLVLLCTIYAIKTRKCPLGFNEARYIAFTNYTTCVIWLIFVPLYLATPAWEGVKIVSLAMSLSLGGFVQLGCLFLPKIHVVLFKPEKNTRDAVMSQQKSSSFSLGLQNHTKLQHQSAPAMIYINGSGNPAFHLHTLQRPKSHSTPSETAPPPTNPEAEKPFDGSKI